MRYCFAPMEGITDAIYRRLHHTYFPGIQSYYMPFFSPTVHRCLTPRESRELPPATNAFHAVPQVLTKNAQDFLWASQVCRDLGYDEINLNLGCPSGTVVAKGKGSGMLRDLDALEGFLSEIFAKSVLPISLKTRLGLESPEEFPAILALYNQFPVKELTVHPRVRKAFYSGSADLEAFAWAYDHTRLPLCYNADVDSVEKAREISRRFPRVQSVMIGRALVGNPGMLTPGWEISQLESFLAELTDSYRVAFGSARNAMFRMKENWSYLLPHFQGSQQLGKQLRKTTDLDRYNALVQEIFATCPYR